MMTGASRALLLLFSLLAPALAAALLAPSAAFAFAPPKEEAVILVSVFRDPGFSLPRAEVILTVQTPPAGRKPAKPVKGVTDSRGEMLFRVPPVAAKYLVTARAPGFAPQEKLVEISGGPERQDAYITLKPEAK